MPDNYCRDIPPDPIGLPDRAGGQAASKPRRPLRELCQALTIVDLVNAGLPTWRRNEGGSVKLVGPASRGIRVSASFDGPWLDDDGFASVRAVRVDRPPGGFARATLRIGSPYAGHVWADEVAVKIAPHKHWLLCCQACGRRARKLFWPPNGAAWRCRRCHNIRYPDPKRLNSLPPRPDAPDPIDAMIRDLQRMKIIQRDIRRATMTRPREPIDAPA